MKTRVGSFSGSNLAVPQGSLELPVRVRRVRDSGSLLFMFAFLAFLAYIIWDGIYVKQTDINLIIHGHDSYGNICGRLNKPIKLAEKSGRNYTDRPYTKYTLINAQFERYTLDTSRTRYGELVYVKEKDQLARQEQRRPQDLQERRKQQTSSSSPLSPPLQFNGPLAFNRAQVNQLKFASAISASPQATSNRTLVAANSTSPSARIANSIGFSSQQHDGNDTDRYDHMLVTPTTSGLMFSSSSRGGVVHQQEVSSQLFYLTECVTSCPADHVELIFYRCMPNNWRFSLFPNAINVSRTFIDDILTDVSHCYRELIYTFSLALVLSLALLILLRFLAAIIIWSCLLILISIFCATAGYSWLTFYQHLMDLNQLVPHDSIFSEKLANSDRWLLGSIFLTFLAFAAIAMVLFMRKRILLVTMLFRESGKAIADMPLLLLQPLLTFAALMGIMGAWIMGWICLQSIKEPQVDLASGTGFVLFKSETLYKLMKWYHMFAFLWVSHFAIACQHYVIGASVSKWYFSPNRYALSSPIGNSISELILYYLGSVALGSFLIAIFKIIRILTRQIQFLIQRSCLSPSPSASSSISNGTPSVNHFEVPGSNSCGTLGYVWRLFIWFFDNIVMIINRDAYVEIAIHGHSFLGGARRAFKVLASNPLRLLAIKSVGNILLIIAKICVVVGTVSMAHFLLQDKNHQLNYAWSPIVISALYAYIVAHWFLSVYEMVIDALFICYCEDYELTKSQSSSQEINGSNFMTQVLKSGQVY